MLSKRSLVQIISFILGSRTIKLIYEGANGNYYQGIGLKVDWEHFCGDSNILCLDRGLVTQLYAIVKTH